MTLYVLIGLPGSGKSTYAEKLCKENKNTVLISSDRIRNGFRITNPFPVAREVLIADVGARRNVVFDATNLTRKNRREWIDIAKRHKYETVAVVMLTPLSKCREWNLNRKRPVPEEVIDKYLRRFEYPYEGEFDKVITIQNGTEELKIEDMSQESKNHSLSLLDHMNKAGKIMESLTEDRNLITAAYNHDIGKPITKTYYDRNGDLTEYAHYYGHDNAGAYLWFTSREITPDNEETGRLINYHMRPYFWEHSDKTEQRDKESFDPGFLEKLRLLHEADRDAH